MSKSCKRLTRFSLHDHRYRTFRPWRLPFPFFLLFFLKSYAKHGLKFETEDSKEWSLIFFFPSPFGETLPKFDLLSGIQWSKVITFFFFFFFRKRKLGNTRVVHASLVSIIKNDGSLWRVEVFDLNNSVIQGRIYFHLNGGGNTNRPGYSVSKIQKYFMDIDRSEISYLWKSFFDDWNRERKIIVDY